MANKTLIFIPTYNERDNVENILGQILSLHIDADIVFLDDNSPDKTGDLLDELATKHERLYVIHRTGKLGIGSAHIDGINWAYDRDYDKLITMDCDFTHSPEYIKQFLEYSEEYDVVVGSRFLQEKSLSDWDWFRRFLTNFGHFLTTLFLSMPYDATGAYRLYRLDRIPREFLSLIHSMGYSFFFESLWILHLNNFKIKEIPTVLYARAMGQSKMRLRDALHSVLHLVHLFFSKLLNKERFEITSKVGQKEGIVDPQNWDAYWGSKQKSSSSLVYDIIAVFYRKFIIKRNLNKHIKTAFAEGSSILHAGCGSGQVDEDIRDYVRITALDISLEALNFYKQVNKDKCAIVHGSIFQIPFENETFDGIYNLGVMEHFSEDEIGLILAEFHRVLKPEGKIVLFWPPEFGASVIFLKFVHYVLNDLLHKNIKLHPDEITRVESKKQIKGYLESSGFKLDKYSFGIGDLFTYTIIHGKKN